jgi:hypothetical protein
MVSTLRSGRERAGGGAAENGGNIQGGASGAENMASQEDTLGPEAQRAVQGVQGGAPGVVLTPGDVGMDPASQNSVQRILFGTNTPQGEGGGLQTIQQLIANAWAGVRGGQNGANTTRGGANNGLGGANSMEEDEPAFM